jgi:23S rRNA pseudouridine2605 synthase
MDDPEGRPTLEQYVPPKQRIFHVGRLDTDTSGLILMTNDGELANRLTHPKWEVSKTYVAELEGVMDNKALKRLEKGVTLEDGPVKPDKLRLISRAGERTLVEVTLHEGRNRVVRRMFDTIGHPVRELSRVAIGPVKLGRLAVGDSRELTREELGALIDLVGM